MQKYSIKVSYEELFFICCWIGWSTADFDEDLHRPTVVIYFRVLEFLEIQYKQKIIKKQENYRIQLKPFEWTSLKLLVTSIDIHQVDSDVLLMRETWLEKLK